MSVTSPTLVPMGRSMDDAERAIQRLRVDARAMQEDAELAVAELARATRSLRDAMLDHARAGSAIRLELGGTTFAGRVVHVGDDVVRLVRADRDPVDVAISALSGVHVAAPDAGPCSVSTGYPATLLARCRELLQANTEVEIGRRVLSPVRGTLAAATATHIEADTSDGGAWLVPLAEVAWIERLGR